MCVCLVGTNVLTFLDVFVVKFMQESFVAVEDGPGIDLAICTEKLYFQAILDGNGANCIGIVDVKTTTYAWPQLDVMGKWPV